jgi:putative ABC transport system permease protein
MAVTTIDPDFLKTFGIKLLNARNFSWENKTAQTGNGNSSGKFIVNQTAMKMLGGEKLLGQEISLTDWGKGTIVGVVKDFNFKSLHSKIEPLILCWDQEGHHLASIKIVSNKSSQTINSIKEVYQSLFPAYPFTYKYMDDFTAGLYNKEFKFGNLITVFTILSILICSMGMIGMISFITERKTKEIGIRKVLGSSIPGIVSMLSKDFIKWIIIANVIAWPIAYYFLNNWLQDFAYKINISWWVFLLSGGIALVIALATVSFQAIKAATANPVESLKYE